MLVRGRVTEEGSGKPIAGARIGYLSNPDRDPQSGAWNSRAATAADGSFQLGVMPAPGYLTVLGPGEDYVLQEIGQRMVLRGSAGRAPHSTPTPSTPGPEAGQREPGRRHHAPAERRREGPGRRAGRPARPGCPGDQPRHPPAEPGSPGCSGRRLTTTRCGIGHFAVHGLAADTEVPVYFLDARHNLGATAISRASRRRTDRSPSGSSPAARPGRGWSTPPASRSPDRATPTGRT